MVVVVVVVVVGWGGFGVPSRAPLRVLQGYHRGESLGFRASHFGFRVQGSGGGEGLVLRVEGLWFGAFRSSPQAVAGPRSENTCYPR